MRYHKLVLSLFLLVNITTVFAVEPTSCEPFLLRVTEQLSRVFVYPIFGLRIQTTAATAQDDISIAIPQHGYPRKIILEFRDNEGNLSKRDFQMAGQGYVISSQSKNRRVYIRQPELLTFSESVPQPNYIFNQEEQLRDAFHKSKPHDRLIPRVENSDASGDLSFVTTRPEPQVLTAKTINAGNFEPLQRDRGLYNFVLLEGENFLRVGVNKHAMLGAGRPAQAAGEIWFARDTETGMLEVAGLTPKSDAYQPYQGPVQLVSVVHALWRQGIFPRKMKLYDWGVFSRRSEPTPDPSTLVLDLEVGPRH